MREETTDDTFLSPRMRARYELTRCDAVRWLVFICVLVVRFDVGAMNAIVRENGALHEKKRGQRGKEGKRTQTQNDYAK